MASLFLSIICSIGLLVAVSILMVQHRALVHSRQDLVRLHESNRLLSEDRKSNGERTRLLVEVYDVLAHRLSLVALQAGALEYRGRSLSSCDIIDTAGLVRGEAHSALSELRDLLRFLEAPMHLSSRSASHTPR